ncbi:thioredoxin family protein [Halorubrum sp. AD140]|uniref:thioredoxin family protein n=1 Tax=Halorubrum sp. AD140 TaxID=3050073 RepID=UPI002ACC6CFD|nr:thioredoxin family protein [Halorubrum sp. AD140]MDZ5811532.1 thioredoxin family protein [Halorubrum sp. AD140]
MDEGRVDAPQDFAAGSRAEGADRTLLATYAVLRDRLPDLSRVQTLVTSVLLDSAESDPAPASGTPKGFLPVHGADAIRIVDNCARCVVYVWRDDCPPCETIRSNLGAVFGNDPPDGVLPLSVYGPDAAGRLREEYDVVGGPTTLFTLDGRVDARFVGVAEVDAIEREIGILRDRSGQ